MKVPGAGPVKWQILCGSLSHCPLLGPSGAGEAGHYSPLPGSELGWVFAEEKNAWPGEAEDLGELEKGGAGSAAGGRCGWGTSGELSLPQ